MGAKSSAQCRNGTDLKCRRPPGGVPMVSAGSHKSAMLGVLFISTTGFMGDMP